MITASELVALKAKVKAEMLRRSHTGSVATYGGTSFDFTVQPTVNGQILAEHGNKIIQPLNAVKATGLSNAVAGQPVPTDFDNTQLLKIVNDMASIPATAASGGCSGSCTGLCQGGCATACTSCTGSCTGTCTGSCTGTCTTSCGSNCSGGCTDTCSGCGGSCSYDCSGCSGTCSSSCTGCSGGCQGSCTKTCGSDNCTSACMGQCTTGCWGACKDCTGSCGSDCSGSCGIDCIGFCSGTHVMKTLAYVQSNDVDDREAFTNYGKIEPDTIDYLESLGYEENRASNIVKTIANENIKVDIDQLNKYEHNQELAYVTRQVALEEFARIKIFPTVPKGMTVHRWFIDDETYEVFAEIIKE